ncbi:5-methylcytosine-specific restriction enzyme B [Bradyrhizobium sp. Rc2d]|uniref:AAA family ATPase n=1 Tax=Bradyrhizobium sp. Rc2d TaxID=1855321 RepID=UPI00087F93C7|nr:AAA family ATPase [Bradyrhizobium sp. Rc2d]SDK00188.1 5-methylcytosine-specific restriction enzyme B [Bradyrhizobium sp. Rc2d]
MLNQILYGPPGTGKTFAVIELALDILDPGYLEANRSNRTALKRRFDELSSDGEVRFVTFHQSFSYEDFVEGLRADHDADGQLRYAVEDGIFKILCETAAAKVTQQAAAPVSIEGRRIWKMSLGNTQASDAYIYDECIENNYILLGYGGDTDFGGCKSREDVFERSQRAGKSDEEDSYAITAVTNFLLKMKKGDVVVVSDGNTKFRAIAEVTGDYRQIAREPQGDGDDKYGQCRDVKWLRVYSPSLPYDQLMRNQFSQMTLYELKSHSIDKAKLTSLLGDTGSPVSTSASTYPAFRIGDTFGSGYEVVYASNDVVELIKPNKKRLPIGMSLIRDLADCVREGKLTVANIRQKEVFEKMPGSLLEPYLVNGYENILSVLVDRYLGFENRSSADAPVVSRPKVLIIDEINRGNVSKIFGELITLIEPSKRKDAEEALEVILPYSKSRFSVPANVHIIGTMNTADRSLTSLDIALRRRFHFREMLPRPELLSAIELQGLNIGQMLSVMNERIEVLLDRDHRLGHAYFLPLREDRSVELLSSIFRQQIMPLLQEYFFDDWERIQMVLNDSRKAPENRFLHRPDVNILALFGDEGSVAERSGRWMINDLAFGRIEAYLGIVDHELKPAALATEREATHGPYTIKQLSSGTIEVWNNGQKEEVAKKPLLEIASKLGLPMTWTTGATMNTRHLGKKVIEALGKANL